jgi:hypothetical protein
MRTQGYRGSGGGRRLAVEMLTTGQVLALYERFFGRLDPQSKQRILRTASTHGWDRTWQDLAREVA